MLKNISQVKEKKSEKKKKRKLWVICCWCSWENNSDDVKEFFSSFIQIFKLFSSSFNRVSENGDWNVNVFQLSDEYKVSFISSHHTLTRCLSFIRRKSHFSDFHSVESHHFESHAATLISCDVRYSWLKKWHKSRHATVRRVKEEIKREIEYKKMSWRLRRLDRTCILRFNLN